MATTGICNSFKSEVMQGGHCLNAVLAQTGTTASNQTLTSMATTAGIAVGMAVTGHQHRRRARSVESITSATAVTVSKTTTGSAGEHDDVHRRRDQNWRWSERLPPLVPSIIPKLTSARQVPARRPLPISGLTRIAASGTYSAGRGWALVNVSAGCGLWRRGRQLQQCVDHRRDDFDHGGDHLQTTAPLGLAPRPRPSRGRTISVHDFRRDRKP